MEEDIHERMIATLLFQLIRELKRCQAERQRRQVLDLELSMIRSERDVLKNSLCKVLKDGVEKANLYSQSTKDILDLQSTVARLYHKLKVMHNYASVARPQADPGNALTFVDNVLRDLSGTVQTATTPVESPSQSIQNTSQSTDPKDLVVSLLRDLDRLTGFSTSSNELGSSFARFLQEEDSKEQLMDWVRSCSITDHRHAQSPVAPLPSSITAVENAHRISPSPVKSDNTKQEVVQRTNIAWDGDYEKLIQAICRGDDSFVNHGTGTSSKGMIDRKLCDGGWAWNCQVGEHDGEWTSDTAGQAQDWATMAGYSKGSKGQNWSPSSTGDFEV